MDLSDISARMQRSLASLRQDLSSIRSGRANPTLIEHVMVSVYNSRMPIKQLGAISAPEQNLLVIDVWDGGIIDAIVKGIQEANIGITPHAEASRVRCFLPALTQERREQLVKLVKQKVEAGRIQIRQIRADAKKSFEEMPEDVKSRKEKELQELVDRAMAEIDGVSQRKEAELMQV